MKRQPDVVVIDEPFGVPVRGDPVESCDRPFCFTSPMVDTREALDSAVTALATGSDQTQSQSVRALVSIALNEPAHRQQALTALEDFTASNHGARSDALVSARTALCGFDPKRAARALWPSKAQQSRSWPPQSWPALTSAAAACRGS